MKISAAITTMLVLLGLYYFFAGATLPTFWQEPTSIAVPTNTEGDATEVKTGIFTGKLEKVDTSCFADGECFIKVDGAHVTALQGWSRETVGSIKGVEAFGDLQNHIGKTVTVYALDLGDSHYTLYGNENYYIKLLR